MCIRDRYRTISITVPVNASALTYEIFVDNITHSILLVGTFGLQSTGYHSCSVNGTEMLRQGHSPVIPPSASNWTCDLTGMIPNYVHQIEVYIDLGDGMAPTLHYWNYNATTSIADEIPPAPNTNPILFAIGSIVCSLIALSLIHISEPTRPY